MIISCDRVIYGDKHTAPEEKAVYIKNEKVVAVAPERELRVRYPDEDVVSYPGCSLMPGMIDMHVHLNAVPDLTYYQEENAVSLCALYTAGRMRHALEAGVTTVRDAYSPFGIGTALNRAAQDGHILSPRVIPCLRGICMIGGHGSDSVDGVTEICGAEEGRAAVRQNFKRGAKWIKVLTSDAYRGVELSQEELDAIVDEAHRLGMGTFAHAGYGASIGMCIQAGFDSIEHGTHLTHEQAITMREHNQTWVPTVFVFQYVYEQVGQNDSELFLEFEKDSVIAYLKESVECYQKHLRALYDTGVRVATGTDIDYTDYASAAPVAQECACLVKCGLTPMESIECATKNGADALGMGKELGQILPGYLADLIVVEGDPSTDISALTRVRATYQSGKRVI